MGGQCLEEQQNKGMLSIFHKIATLQFGALDQFLWDGLDNLRDVGVRGGAGAGGWVCAHMTHALYARRTQRTRYAELH